MPLRKKHDSRFLFLQGTVAAQIHFIGFIAAFFGLYFLIKLSSNNPDPKHYWGNLIYLFTAMLVFGTSSLYHFLKEGFYISDRTKDWFEDLDHFSIYLFIAGTYTPFLINVVAEPWQTRILILVWIIAIIGIFYTYYRPRLPRWAQSRLVYTGLFLLMGWTISIRISEILEKLSAVETSFLLMGAMCYTVGAVIYALKKPNLFPGIFGFHELWHVAVLLGALFHYFLIYQFYM
ncbi:MAG: hemolysin III family protein [Bdellovibrionota bacterium]